MFLLSSTQCQPDSPGGASSRSSSQASTKRRRARGRYTSSWNGSRASTSSRPKWTMCSARRPWKRAASAAVSARRPAPPRNARAGRRRQPRDPQPAEHHLVERNAGAELGDERAVLDGARVGQRDATPTFTAERPTRDPHAPQLVLHVDRSPLGRVALHQEIGTGPSLEADAEALAGVPRPVQPHGGVPGRRRHPDRGRVVAAQPADEAVEIGAARGVAAAGQARPSAFARIQSCPTARWTKFLKKAGEFFSYTQCPTPCRIQPKTKSPSAGSGAMKRPAASRSA